MTHHKLLRCPGARHCPRVRAAVRRASLSAILNGTLIGCLVRSLLLKGGAVLRGRKVRR